MTPQFEQNQLRAFVYVRVSGDDRKYATSGIEGQLKECRQYCQNHNYQIMGEFYEEPEKHTSGYDWLPELEKVLRLAQQRVFDVLVVREVDRLARNRFKQMSIENQLESLGIRVEYVIGQYEDTAEGRLLKGLMGEFAEYERDKIKQRTDRGRIQSVKAGNVTIGGSYAPYGYDLIKNGHRTLIINEYEASVVRLIFNLYVNENYTLHGIADYLDAHGVAKPAKGNNHKKRTNKNRIKGWSVGTLNGILDNETYIGRWYFRKTKTVKNPKTGKFKNVLRPESDWLMLEVPAILNEDIFEAAKKRREANKRQMGKNRKHEYLLGGMSTCGHCGCGVSGITKVQGDKQWSYYKCNAHHLPKRYGFKCENSVQFRVEAVDNAVWGWIKSILVDPTLLKEALETYVQQQLETQQPLIKMIEANQAKLALLQQQRERLIKAYTAGILSLDDIAAQKTALDKEMSDLIQANQKLQTELEPHILSQQDINAIQSYADKIRQGANLADDDFATRRSIMELLKVQVSFLYVERQRWVDITCVFGEKHLPTEIGTTCSIGKKSGR